MITKWDERFLKLAEHVAQWSKDPSTKTGAVIVRSRKVVSLGFNGFPWAFADTKERLEDRDFKYKHIVHCEVNAILNAGQSVNGCTLYTWPFGSCGDCAKFVVQAGITRVVYPAIPAELRERWKESCDRAAAMFGECGVVIDEA